MKFQIRAADGQDYMCGPASLQNALRDMGIRVGQHKIATLCGTTAEGTDDDQLKIGLIRLGRVYAEIREPNECAWGQLKWALQNQGPVVMCVDRWQHWVCAYAYARGRVRWFDPAKTPWNLAENGHHSVDRGRLMRRWAAARRDVSETGCKYYGLVVM